MVIVPGSEAEIVVRLVIAAALGSLVGLEREMSHRSAGFRTHTLVAFGAALFASVSLLFFGADSRVVAGIVTGIGFIGAGNIISARGKVVGITTAASLWAVAAIGMTVGLGYYIIGVASAVIVFAVLQLKRIEKVERIGKRN